MRTGVGMPSFAATSATSPRATSGRFVVSHSDRARICGSAPQRIGCPPARDEAVPDGKEALDVEPADLAPREVAQDYERKIELVGEDEGRRIREEPAREGELRFGKARAEGPDRRADDLRRHGRRDRNAKAASPQAARVRDDAFGALDVREHRLGAGQEPLALLGRQEPPSRADEERHAAFALELREGLRHGGLREVQGGRGRAHAARPDDLEENPELAELHLHRCASSIRPRGA